MNRIMLYSSHFKSQTHRFGKKMFLALTLLCALSTIGRSQKSQPGVRNAHVVVYDQKQGQVLLFGGADEQQVRGDLWRFTGKKWKKLNVKGPSPRTFPSIVYDEKNKRVVLFGGSKVLFGQSTSSDNLLNDTWVYQNKKWTPLKPAQAPGPRAEASMTYDPLRQKIYLFGGYKIVGEDYIKLGDTWELDGFEWKKITEEGPSPRHGVVMDFHEGLQQVILFGGSTVDRDYSKHAGESWTFDGQSWAKINIVQPPNIFNASGCYGANRLIRFGGWNGNTRVNETWQFVDNRWEQIETKVAPSPRNHSAMAWDEKNERFLLYGGHDGENVFGDTWIFSKEEWTLLGSRAALRRVDNGH